MTEQVISEIDSIIHLLEAQLPASMSNPKNIKLERAFKKSMANYFDSLADAFPFDKLEALYLDNVKEVSSPPKKPKTAVGALFDDSGKWEEYINSLLTGFKVQLTQMVAGHLTQIYVAGSTQMMSYGKTKLGKDILFEGPPIRQAIDWARDYCAKLVTKMDDETKSRLAQVISDGIENKRGIDGLSRDIRKEFDDMSKSRADMIAQTETNQALSQASMDRMRDMGVDGKEWVVIGDDAVCDICDGNAEQGVIPVDQPFQSGDMQTPGHPRCRCCTSPARLGRNDTRESKRFVLEGGSGSGNFGHSGRPGEVGGSGSGGGGSYQQVSAKKFKTSVSQNKRQQFMTGYSVQELSGFRTYLSPDGKTGYALKPDGDLVNVFNNGAHGEGSKAIERAI